MESMRFPESDHYDGRKFFNPDGRQVAGLRDVLRWQMHRKQGPWPKWVDSDPVKPERAVGEERIRLTFVNHSTVLIQTGGVNVLTDPIWALRASPVGWAGPKRVCAPGVRLEDLPPIHLLLLSHNHYDHLDVQTFKTIVDRDKPHIVVPLGLRAYLGKRGVAVSDELDWWHNGAFPGFEVTCVPARHFSGRGLWDRNQTLWCGYVLHTPAGNIYFAGDTGWGDHFDTIRRRCGPIRIAVLPIGAFLPKWFMSPVHISPEEAVRAHTVLQPELSAAIHFDTFALADDAYGQARAEIARAAGIFKIAADSFWVPKFGEEREFAKLPTSR